MTRADLRTVARAFAQSGSEETLQALLDAVLAPKSAGSIVTNIEPSPLTLSEAYTKVMRQGEVAAAEVQAEREELVQATLAGGAE